MVKPKQVFQVAGFGIIPLVLHFLPVQSQRIAAPGGSVETDPCRIGPVVINGRPVGPCALRQPGFRAEMYALSHDVVQPERGREIHVRFSRLQQDIFDDGHCRRVLGPGHFHPFVGNLRFGERMIPCQATERIPVGLRHQVTCPVPVGAGVGDSGNGREVV